MAARKVLVSALYFGSDESVWGKLPDVGKFHCVVCNTLTEQRWACVIGKWEGAIIVACNDAHAIEGIEKFINYERREEETN